MPDVLIRAIDAEAGLRILTAFTTELSQEAARRHEVVGMAANALSRGLTAGALLATLTKSNERVTLQIQSEGPLGGVTVDAQIDPGAPGQLRGYLVHPHAVSTPSLGRGRLVDVLGRTGVVNVMRDVGLRDRYQGQVAMLVGEIDEDVEHYLRVSEQVPSALGCDVLMDNGLEITAAAGVLVQALPGATDEGVRPAQHALRTGVIYDYLRGGGRSARELAEVAYGGPVEVIGEQPLSFHCRCSQERVEDLLRLLTTVDLDEMIAEDGEARVTCNFCNTRYVIGRDVLERLRAELARGPRGNN